MIKSGRIRFHQVRLSLSALLGGDYIRSVCDARAALSGESRSGLRAVAGESVDCYPESFQRRLLGLLPRVGRRCVRPLGQSAKGATTAGYRAHSQLGMAPLSAMGYYRVGEDGRLYLISKSEHYHVPLGHAFPGYRLIENARRLGIPNATHNNTRGHITRLLEEELIRTANGLAPGSRPSLTRIVDSKSRTMLNRVINLETGSLAMEAAIKMVLSRFYKLQENSPEPVYPGRIPVLVVLGDDEGRLQGNYHGTTIVAQTLRGLWSTVRSGLESKKMWLVRSVRPNHIEDLRRLFAQYDTKPYKIAGLFHELILMNYGGITLTKPFVKQAYALCRSHDVPTVADEIQSCMWSPELYLFREYGVMPAFVAIGKGFPGGEYPASRIIFNAGYDCLPQFGALVTNGQEELASLAYLVTMRWAEANADVTARIGEYYEERLRELAAQHPECIVAVEGRRHLAALWFNEMASAAGFVACLKKAGLDISVQTYKPQCPPVALTKLPLTTPCEVVDRILDRMQSAIEAVERRGRRTMKG